MSVNSDKQGLLIVVSGPSGTGKGTVINLLRIINPRIMILPSATTRTPRPGERDGYNYFFKSKERFLAMVENEQFVEWVEYCGNFYGTPKEQLDDSLNKGFDVILEKEVEGALKIKESYPNCVNIFIIPPSIDELKRRIELRGTEGKAAIKERLSRAMEELEYINNYDYVVVNNSIEKAADDMNSIIYVEKLKTIRNRYILDKIKTEQEKW